MGQREGDVFLHGQVREQVELLEHHSYSLADGVGVHSGVGDVIATKPYLTIVDLLQQVYAAQEC